MAFFVGLKIQFGYYSYETNVYYRKFHKVLLDRI